MKRSRGVPAVAAAFLLLVSMATPEIVAAKARPGSLDQTFGTGGIVKLRAQREEYARPAFQIAPLPGGGAVVLTTPTLTRLERDGKRDKRFGRNGQIAVGEIDGSPFRPSDLAVDSRGRILLAGTTFATTPQPGSGDGQPLLARSATLLRFMANGKLDPSFGNDGVFSSTFGLQPPVYRPPYPYAPIFHYESPAVEATGVAVDSSDRPVLTGTVIAEMTGCRDRAVGSVPHHGSFLARLTADGQLDPTFNGTGIRTAEAEFSAEEPVVDRSNGVAYIRSVGDECENLGGNVRTVGVGELSADGVPNPAFGPDEVAGFPAAQAVAVDGRGRILLLRSQLDWEGELIGPTVQAVRLLPNGLPDPSFGRNGTATLLSKGFLFSAITADGHQRVLLAGERFGGKRSSFGLVRLQADGKVDRRFGRRGRTTIGLGKIEVNSIGGGGIRVAADRRERVLVGRYGTPGSEGWRVDLARFLP
jgi:uncharacterized delta-60 repeat protein